MIHTDVLGREIRIRDLVIRVSKFTTCVSPYIVTSLTKRMIKVNEGIKCSPDRIVVISDQVYANGVDHWSNVLETKFFNEIQAGLEKYERYIEKHGE